MTIGRLSVTLDGKLPPIMAYGDLRPVAHTCWPLGRLWIHWRHG